MTSFQEVVEAVARPLDFAARDDFAHLERVREYCRSIGLHVVGRFGSYSYFNSDACVRQAMDLVETLTAG